MINGKMTKTSLEFGGFDLEKVLKEKPSPAPVVEQEKPKAKRAHHSRQKPQAPAPYSAPAPTSWRSRFSLQGYDGFFQKSCAVIFGGILPLASLGIVVFLGYRDARNYFGERRYSSKLMEKYDANHDSRLQKSELDFMVSDNIERMKVYRYRSTNPLNSAIRTGDTKEVSDLLISQYNTDGDAALDSRELRNFVTHHIKKGVLYIQP